MVSAERTITDKVKQFSSQRRSRIAIGLDPLKTLPEDLANAASLCDLVVVGRRIQGYECIVTTTPEKDLLEQLLHGLVHGIVRGQLDDTRFLEQVLHARALKWTDIHHVSLLRDHETEFWLAPVSNTECWIKQDKMRLLTKMLSLYRALSIDARIALISGVRESDVGPQWYFDGMYYDSEEIAAHYRDRISSNGWVKHFNMETEHALGNGANLLMMPNGMVGNQCYRLLVYRKFVECVVNLYLGAGLNIVTNSRNEKLVSNYVIWANAIANGLMPIHVL
jgi:predicted methyltransferase MtxX (methanogen marker protein 4)